LKAKLAERDARIEAQAARIAALEGWASEIATLKQQMVALQALVLAEGPQPASLAAAR
jgi:hypothetical protein